MSIDKDEILRNIGKYGTSSESNKRVNPIIVANRDSLNNIINLSSGIPGVRAHVLRKFELIFSQPLALGTMNPLELRCCLCRNIITYPCWYYVVKYTVNQMHYFICHNAKFPNKVTALCFSLKG